MFCFVFKQSKKKKPAESRVLTSASALLVLLFSAGFILNQVSFLSLMAALDSHSWQRVALAKFRTYLLLGHSPTCEQGNGAFFKMPCCGINHSFILRKKVNPMTHPPPVFTSSSHSQEGFLSLDVIYGCSNRVQDLYFETLWFYAL